ncbi:MAG: rhomboid family intramembrane serine protease [Methanotrichaceae archaeon]
MKEFDNQWNDPDPWDESRYSPPSGKFGISLTCSEVILAICVFLSLMSLVVPSFIYNYLALKPALVTAQPWTLITHMFLHASLFHLFVNMIFLFFFGTELERRVGEGLFLLIFIFSGIVGAIGQIAVDPASYIPMVGASGALYGVMGCLVIIAPEIKVIIFPIPIPLSILAAVTLFVFMDLVMMGSGDSIAHMAHLAGLAAGLVFGGLLKDQYKYR